MSSLSLVDVSVKFSIYGGASRVRSFFSDVFRFNRVKQDFWALKDVSFTLEKGDRLAVIGGNGAGKSTLLKVVAGILPPTNGSLDVVGIVNSAILASDGLYFEATCLQNIYLKAASQGLTRTQTERYCKEVIEIADMGKFINSRLKTLSTGMRARLIVAMQIGMKPNILVMDEWIGTADRKVVDSGTLSDLVNSTDIFVLASHRAAIIKEHCNKGLYLENGIVRYFGDLEKALEMAETKKR